MFGALKYRSAASICKKELLISVFFVLNACKTLRHAELASGSIDSPSGQITTGTYKGSQPSLLGIGLDPTRYMVTKPCMTFTSESKNYINKTNGGTYISDISDLSRLLKETKSNYSEYILAALVQNNRLPQKHHEPYTMSPTAVFNSKTDVYERLVDGLRVNMLFSRTFSLYGRYFYITGDVGQSESVANFSATLEDRKRCPAYSSIAAVSGSSYMAILGDYFNRKVRPSGGELELAVQLFSETADRRSVVQWQSGFAEPIDFSTTVMKDGKGSFKFNLEVARSWTKNIEEFEYKAPVLNSDQQQVVSKIIFAPTEFEVHYELNPDSKMLEEYKRSFPVMKELSEGLHFLNLIVNSYEDIGIRSDAFLAVDRNYSNSGEIYQLAEVLRKQVEDSKPVILDAMECFRSAVLDACSDKFDSAKATLEHLRSKLDPRLHFVLKS